MKRNNKLPKVSTPSPPPPKTHEIIVDNIGSVYYGIELKQAMSVYAEYCRLMRLQVGRIGESVTWLIDGEIYREKSYTPVTSFQFEIQVANVWMEDGFNLTPQRLKDLILTHMLPYADPDEVTVKAEKER